MRSPKAEEQETDLECEKCASKMVVKWGRNGHFLACSNYPACKNTKPYQIDDEGKVVAEDLPDTDEVCEKCGAPMVVKRGRKGSFLSCSAYPGCKSTRPIAEVKDGKAIAAPALPETDETCAKCGAPMVVKNGRKGLFLSCSKYPECRTTRPIAEIKNGKAIPAAPAPEIDVPCEKCGAPMVIKTGRRGPFLACSAFPKCRNAKPLPAELAEAAGLIAQPQPRAKAIVTEEKCENCGKPMAIRQGRRGPFLGCTGYPRCKTARNADPEILEKYKQAAETDDGGQG
jgi:DNA topoisomerase-1